MNKIEFCVEAMLPLMQALKDMTAERDALLALMESKTAHMNALESSNKAWHEKTDWVQTAMNTNKLSFKFLGCHRADVMTQHIKELETELAAFKSQEPCPYCWLTQPGVPAPKKLKEALDKPAAQEHPISSGHPDDAGFELWWSEHMPEAVQSVAISAWNAAQSTVREARPVQPVRARALTDNEWFTFWLKCDQVDYESAFPDFLLLARAIEARFGIKAPS